MASAANQDTPPISVVPNLRYDKSMEGTSCRTCPKDSLGGSTANNLRPRNKFGVTKTRNKETDQISVVTHFQRVRYSEMVYFGILQRSAKKDAELSQHDGGFLNFAFTY